MLVERKIKMYFFNKLMDTWTGQPDSSSSAYEVDRKLEAKHCLVISRFTVNSVHSRISVKMCSFGADLSNSADFSRICTNWRTD